MNILLFKMSTCSPCKLMGRTLDQLGISYTEIIIDQSEEGDEKADNFNIKLVPTIVILDKNNNELSRICGIRTKDNLLEEINKYNDRD